MKPLFQFCRGAAGVVLILVLYAIGCEGETATRPESRAVPKPSPTTGDTGTIADEATGAAKDAQGDDPAPTPQAKRLGKGVFFERDPRAETRRVFVTAWVCLREGGYGLECLLCRKGTKEHESILATDADARLIHFGLEACGIKAGVPVQFDPKFKSPTGGKVKVSLQYQDKGKTVTIPAQRWVKNVKTNKDLDQDWVFAGSRLFQDPEDPKKEPIYLAREEGSYICVTNVPTAMLDLPIESPKALENREFAPWTERIPELQTRVVLILESLPAEKKK